MAGPNILNFASKVVFLNGTPLTLPTASSNPGSAAAGDLFYNTTTNSVEFYNGTTWVSVGTVSLTGQVLSSGDIIVGNGSNLSAAVPVTGDISLSNAGVTALTATTNSTLTTLSALSLPASQVTGLSSLYANTALSNLGATAVNADIDPGTTNSISLGASNHQYLNAWVLRTQILNSPDQGLFGLLTGVTGTPVTGMGMISTGDGTGAPNPISVASANSSSFATSAVQLVTGNGTGHNSGNIVLTVGSASGATQGTFKFLKTGVASVSGQIWTASATDGTGYWATAASSLPAPLEALASYTSNFWGNPGTFVGNNSDTDQTNQLVQFGSTDTSTPNNKASDVILSGGSQTAPSGSGSPAGVYISAGNVTGTATAGGNVVLQSGNSGTGAGGYVVISTGTGIPQGLIQLQDGTQGTSGQVWTSIDASGSGHWVAASAGSVTSVALSLPSFITVTGSPVTSSGTLTGTLATQTANTVFAGPTTGAAAAPTFRGLVVGDLSFAGSAGGVATLDGGGKVPLSQLPATLMEFQGNWDPTTNTPTLVDGTGTTGFTYWVSAADAGPVAGLTDPSMVNFQIGDLVIYNGTKWVLVTPAAGVSSVNGAQGAVVMSMATANGFAGTYSGTALTVSTTVNGILSGNGTAISAASTTGSGAVVLATSPTLVTPVLGAASATSITVSGATAANGGITSTGTLTINANSAGSPIDLYSSSVLRGASGAAVTETYVDSTTLTDASGPTAVSAFTFTAGTTAGEVITYVIENGATPSLVRVGTIRVTASSDGSNPSLSDMYTESGDCGVNWTVTHSGTAISVNYTTTSQGQNRIMRSDIKSFRY